MNKGIFKLALVFLLGLTIGLLVNNEKPARYEFTHNSSEKRPIAYLLNTKISDLWFAWSKGLLKLDRPDTPSKPKPQETSIKPTDNYQESINRIRDRILKDPNYAEPINRIRDRILKDSNYAEAIKRYAETIKLYTEPTND